MNIGTLFSLATSNIFGHGISTAAGSLGTIVVLAVETWVNAGAPLSASGAAMAVAPAVIGALFGPKK